MAACMAGGLAKRGPGPPIEMTTTGTSCSPTEAFDEPTEISTCGSIRPAWRGLQPLRFRRAYACASSHRWGVSFNDQTVSLPTRKR